MEACRADRFLAFGAGFKRRLHLIGLLHVFVVGLALIAAGCQPVEIPPTPTATIAPTPAATPTEAPTPTVPEGSPLRGVVRVWLSWDPQELESLERVVRSFQLEYPEITFEIAYFPQESLKEAFLNAGTGPSSPTLLFGPSIWGPELWVRGVLLDLQGRLGAELQQTIDPVAWSQVVYRDAVIGLPLERHGVVLYRNRAWADDPAGTTQAWREAASDLREGENVGLALDYGFRYSASQIAACDGELLDEDGGLLIQGEVGICWMNLLRDLRQVGRVTFNSDENLDLFLGGQAAWLLDGTWNIDRLRREIGEDRLVVDPWPVFSETESPLRGFVWTENVYLRPTQSASDLEASWAFVRFLLNPDAQMQLADPTAARHLPALAQLDLQDPFQMQAQRALASGVGLPLIPNLDLYMEPIEGAVRSVAIQGANPELALTIAVTKIEQALAQLEAGP
jgi:maltose-binding protein MalE